MLIPCEPFLFGNIFSTTKDTHLRLQSIVVLGIKSRVAANCRLWASVSNLLRTEWHHNWASLSVQNGFLEWLRCLCAWHQRHSSHPSFLCSVFLLQLGWLWNPDLPGGVGSRWTESGKPRQEDLGEELGDSPATQWQEGFKEELGKLCHPAGYPADFSQDTLSWENSNSILAFSLFRGPVQDPGPLPRLVSSVFSCQVD